jgi:hypothetical protein
LDGSTKASTASAATAVGVVNAFTPQPRSRVLMPITSEMTTNVKPVSAPADEPTMV